MSYQTYSKESIDKMFADLDQKFTHLIESKASQDQVTDHETRIKKLELSKKSPLLNYCPAYFSATFKQAGQTLTDFERIIKSAVDNPRATIVVAINPNNGNDFNNTALIEIVKKMKSVGIIVLGYVYLLNGNRPLTEVFDRVSRMKSIYGVDGIMFDESAFPDTPEMEAHVKAIIKFTKDLALYIKCNPGTDPALRYEDELVDNWSIIEGTTLPSLTAIQQAADTLAIERRSATLHHISTPIAEWIKSTASKGLKMFYIQSVPATSNTYGYLSPTWEEQVAIASSIQ